MGITHKFRIGSLPVKSTDGGWDKPSCTHLFRPCLGIVETLSTPIPTVSPCCAQYRACVERSLGWSRTSHICISGTTLGLQSSWKQISSLPDSLSGYLHAGRVVPGNILRCVQSELHPNVRHTTRFRQLQCCCALLAQRLARFPMSLNRVGLHNTTSGKLAASWPKLVDPEDDRGIEVLSTWEVLSNVVKRRCGRDDPRTSDETTRNPQYQVDRPMSSITETQSRTAKLPPSFQPLKPPSLSLSLLPPIPSHAFALRRSSPFHFGFRPHLSSSEHSNEPSEWS